MEKKIGKIIGMNKRQKQKISHAAENRIKEPVFTRTLRLKFHYLNPLNKAYFKRRASAVSCRDILLWHGSGTTSEVDINFNAVLQ